MARKINEREIYVLSTRRFVTWKAHSAYQTRAAADAARDVTPGITRAHTKIEQVTLNV